MYLNTRRTHIQNETTVFVVISFVYVVYHVNTEYRTIPEHLSTLASLFILTRAAICPLN